MSADVGDTVIHVLEEAAKRYLRDVTPEIYHQFLLQIGGADTVRRYDGTADYWQRVQAILDCFFTAAERAEIMGGLVDQASLRSRPECRGFVACALAERGVQTAIRANAFGRLSVTEGPVIPTADRD
jgi:hypothetical protein